MLRKVKAVGGGGGGGDQGKVFIRLCLVAAST